MSHGLVFGTVYAGQFYVDGDSASPVTMPAVTVRVLKALTRFFTLFSKSYRLNDFYMTGESYIQRSNIRILIFRSNI